MVDAKRVVLAYSGGLDTSVAVKWIQEEWGAEVVALAVDVGQVPDADQAYWDAVVERARALRGSLSDEEAHARRDRVREIRAHTPVEQLRFQPEFVVLHGLRLERTRSG